MTFLLLVAHGPEDPANCRLGPKLKTSDTKLATTRCCQWQIIFCRAQVDFFELNDSVKLIILLGFGLGGIIRIHYFDAIWISLHINSVLVWFLCWTNTPSLWIDLELFDIFQNCTISSASHFYTWAEREGLNRLWAVKDLEFAGCQGMNRNWTWQ